MHPAFLEEHRILLGNVRDSYPTIRMIMMVLLIWTKFYTSHKKITSISDINFSSEKIWDGNNLKYFTFALLLEFLFLIVWNVLVVCKVFCRYLVKINVYSREKLIFPSRLWLVSRRFAPLKIPKIKPTIYTSLAGIKQNINIRSLFKN